MRLIEKVECLDDSGVELLTHLFRMMVPLIRIEMNSMENVPVRKSMQRVLNLLENFSLMQRLLYLKNRHVRIVSNFLCFSVFMNICLWLNFEDRVLCV